MNYRTPLIRDSDGVFLKAEHHLLGGSYKARGVEVYLGHFSSPPRKLRVLSAGNMARTVAMLAREYGIAVEAMVPETIPDVKRKVLLELGVTLLPLSFAALWQEVDSPSSGDETPLLHPVDSPKLLEGYGNIAREILAQIDVSEIVVPMGVGGLTLGISQVMRQLAPEVRVVVAENDGASPLFNGFDDPGSRVERRASWIDAIGTPYCLPRVREQLLGNNPLIDEIRTVSPEAALAAGRDLYQRQGELIEGAAAVALAAARQNVVRRAEVSGRERGKGKTVAILTGQNVDPVIYR